MGTALRVLLVEDSAEDAELVLRHLKQGGYDVTSTRVETADDMQAVLAGQSWDIIISDYVLPRFSGPEALMLATDEASDLPFIMVSGAVGEEMAAPIVRERECDYLTKDSLARLVPTVERELREAEERRRRRTAEASLRQREAFFRSLIENAWDVVLVIGTDGIIRYLSPSAHRVFGSGPRARVGRMVTDIIHPEDAWCLSAALARSARELGVPQRVEVRGFPEDTSCLALEVLSNAHSDESGSTHIVLNARDITPRRQAEEELAGSLRRIREVFEGTVDALAATVEIRDPYTAGHQKRVATLACAIAGEMGLSEKEIEGIRVAGTLHDIGKVCVPLDTLNKAGPLTEPEMDAIKAHPRTACDILDKIAFPWPVADAVLQHHERMDGSGYPAGLSGEDIALEARVLAVADTMEAMSSHRPYRPALGISVALAEVRHNKGVLYDADAVTCCVRLFADKGFEFPGHAAFPVPSESAGGDQGESDSPDG